MTMDKEDLIETLPSELPMIRVLRTEYEELAIALGKAPFARTLVLSNGTRVGWMSNRFTYASPVAYKVATGRFPKWYRDDSNPSKSDR